MLENPGEEVPDYVYSRTVDPEKAPDQPAYVTVDFERGDPVAVDGKAMSPAALLAHLNALGRQHGIGRLDLVENRFVGMKSRGMYETPGGTILLAAHRGIEQITLDRGAAHLKDELMPKYAELIYYGFWFAPEREMLQAAIDRSQEFVTGRVRLKLYKGSVGVVGRESRYSLYDQDLVTFEEGKVAYDQRDAAGFIRLNALRLRTLGQRKRKLKHLRRRVSLFPRGGERSEADTTRASGRPLRCCGRPDRSRRRRSSSDGTAGAARARRCPSRRRRWPRGKRRRRRRGPWR